MIFNRFKKVEGVGRKSYAQSGEDILIDYILSWMGITSPEYLDIGAHHPTYLSNTYYFYLEGCRGVCVEPDPILMKEIEKKRPRDACLRMGVGKEDGEADFFIMTERTLNTFSKKEADMYKLHYKNMKIEETVKTPIKNINSIIKENFERAPNILSIDVEGMDLEILQALDLKTYRPEVISAETIVYTGPSSLRKNQEIISLLHKKGYFIYGETLINSVFVDKEAWAKRKMPVIEELS